MTTRLNEFTEPEQLAAIKQLAEFKCSRFKRNYLNKILLMFINNMPSWASLWEPEEIDKGYIIVKDTSDSHKHIVTVAGIAATLDAIPESDLVLRSYNHLNTNHIAPSHADYLVQVSAFGHRVYELE